jgi:hypothetical protein
MAILSRMSWSEVYKGGTATGCVPRETCGDGEEGVFGVVLAEGFCVCDIKRSRSAWDMARLPAKDKESEERHYIRIDSYEVSPSRSSTCA